jgi:hypothetical protein
VSLFQSNLRKQIRNLPKILNFVKKNHYYSKLFTSLLKQETRPHARSFTGLTDFAERAAAPSPGSCCCGVGRANAMPIAQQGREPTTIENKFRDPTRSMKTIFDDCQENTKKGLPYA